MASPDLGFELASIEDGLPVIRIIDADGPAARAGLADGDIIISMDDLPLLKFFQSVWWPRGPRPIAVHYRRAGGEHRCSIAIEEPKPEPSPPPKPERSMRPLSPAAQEIVPFLRATIDILKHIRSAVGQLEARGITAHGVGRAIGELEMAFKSEVPESFDKRALLKYVHGLARAAENFGLVVERACRSTMPLSETLDRIPDSSRVLISWLRATAAAFTPAPALTARMTELVGFAERSQAPMMSAMNVISTEPSPFAHIPPPNRGPRPMSGPMRWADETGARIDWDEPPDTPDYLELVPEDRAKLEHEIQCAERMLRSAHHPRVRANYERRLEVLRSAALGIEPPPRPARRRLESEPSFGRELDQHEQKRLYWEFVNSCADAVAYINRPVAWDANGNVTAIETTERVDPEVHRQALDAVEAWQRSRDPSQQWERRYGAVEAGLKADQARTGIPWNTPTHLRSAYERRAALDWAAPGPGEWNPWRR